MEVRLCQPVCALSEVRPSKREHKLPVGECAGVYVLDSHGVPVAWVTHNAGVEGSSPSLSTTIHGHAATSAHFLFGCSGCESSSVTGSRDGAPVQLTPAAACDVPRNCAMDRSGAASRLFSRAG
jgi:hypothetical protein